MLTEKTNTLEINVTEEQVSEFYSPNRRLIQDIFPNISRSEAEFIKSGVTDEEWKTLFNEI
jgi:hypothetical protein